MLRRARAKAGRMFKAVDVVMDFRTDCTIVKFDDGGDVGVTRFAMAERGVPSYWAKGKKDSAWESEVRRVAEEIRAIRDVQKYGAEFMKLYHEERAKALACRE